MCICVYVCIYAMSIGGVWEIYVDVPGVVIAKNANGLFNPYTTRFAQRDLQ